MSSLTANRPASEATALAESIRPGDILRPSARAADSGLSEEPPIIGSLGQDERGPSFQAHKAAFFFKLERELEKVSYTHSI